jgi:hypothetical protein
VTTIATFSKPEEAHLLRTRFEAVGLPAFVQDENIVQLNWLYSNAIGGVRVQVPDTDAAAAREFLAADAPQPSPGADDIPCPACGSHRTAPDETFRRLAFLSILLLQFPAVCPRGRWRCMDCRHSFLPPKFSPPTPDNALPRTAGEA